MSIQASIQRAPVALEESSLAQLYAFQSALHRLLEGFLNDYFLTRSSRLLSPWGVRYHKGQVSALAREVLSIARSELPSNGIIDLSRPKNVAQVAASGYRAFSTAIGGARRTLPKIVQASGIFESARYESLADLRELVVLQEDMQALAGEIRAAYLFASSADLEIAPGFSDVDCLVILRQATVEDPERLLELRRRLLRCLVRCYRIDPFQHHGFFIATESDLAVYPESFLPLLLIERGIALLSNEPLSFYLRDDRKEARQSLARHLGVLRALRGDGGPQTFFNMKSLISAILLLPSLVLHSLGRPTYKRDSFEPARPLFSTEAWKAVETASTLRKIWPQRILPRPLVRALSVWPNPHVLPLVARIPRLNAVCHEALAEGLLGNVGRLVDEAWRYAGDENC
jgi:hypothetical protein